MSRRKLKKFNQLKQYSNVVSYLEKGAKKKIVKFIASKKKCILELGCGRGEYSLALAQRFSKTNFIGIDIKGDRIWHGAKQAIADSLTNVFFIRMYIDDLLDFFPKKSVDEIWLTFSDPFPRKGDINKRLTAPKFLKIYQQLLKRNGLVHLKTDAISLYEYSLSSIENFGATIVEKSNDLYAKDSHFMNEILIDIQTHYEKRHLKDGKTIKYIKFSFS